MREIGRKYSHDKLTDAAQINLADRGDDGGRDDSGADDDGGGEELGGGANSPMTEHVSMVPSVSTSL
jgi:hypothetical protein